MDTGLADAPTSSDQATLPIFRALLAIQVLAAAAFGLAPFVAPEAFASLGGLAGSEPFIYRLAGAATLGYGVAALLGLRRPRWERLRIPMVATCAFNAAAVLAMLLNVADGESPWVVWFILVAASAFTLLSGYWLVRNQGPYDDRSAPASDTFRLVLALATVAATLFGVVPLIAAEGSRLAGRLRYHRALPVPHGGRRHARLCRRGGARAAGARSRRDPAPGGRRAGVQRFLRGGRRALPAGWRHLPGGHPDWGGRHGVQPRLRGLASSGRAGGLASGSARSRRPG